MLTMTIYLLFLCMVTFILYTYWRWNKSRTVLLAKQLVGPPGYPIIGNGLLFFGGDYLGALDKLRVECGRLGRIWMCFRLVVIASGPEVIETILNNKAAFSKGPYYEVLKPILEEGLVTSNNPSWHYNRKVVAPAFNIFKLKTYTQTFTEESDKLAINWKEKIGKKFSPFNNSIGLFSCFSMRTALGDRLFFKLIESVDIFSMAGELRDLSEIVTKRFFNPLLFLNCIFQLTPEYKKLQKLLGIYDNLLELMIRMKREDYDDDDSFLSLAIKAEKTYPKFQKKQIFDELKTYISAGFETTATAANLVFILLGIHSEIQEKVYQEQMEILGGIDSEPTFDDLNKMVYLEQVIKETLRLFPVIPIISRETNDEIKVGDKFLPKGCSIAIAPYIVHRSEENYPNPLVFNPDRFLPEVENKRHPYAFLGFGGGPRVCIGQRYAMYSMKAFISAVIKRYRIHTDYGLDHVLKTMRTAIALLVHDYEISITER